MDHSETLEAEAVDWLHRNNFGVRVNQQPLDLYPLLLFIAEVVGALPFLDLLIKFIDDNRDEQVHNEEGRDENVNDVEQTDHW